MSKAGLGFVGCLRSFARTHEDARHGQHGSNGQDLVGAPVQNPVRTLERGLRNMTLLSNSRIPETSRPGQCTAVWAVWILLEREAKQKLAARVWVGFGRLVT